MRPTRENDDETDWAKEYNDAKDEIYRLRADRDEYHRDLVAQLRAEVAELASTAARVIKERDEYLDDMVKQSAEIAELKERLDKATKWMKYREMWLGPLPPESK